MPRKPRSHASATEQKIQAATGAESVKIVGRSGGLKRQRKSATTMEGSQPSVMQYRQAFTGKHYASVGPCTAVNASGEVVTDLTFLSRRRAGVVQKTGGIFGGGGQDGADISDSENMQSYNFEFPNDALELPQSRREEIRYYRIACDRDPIVGRGIELHMDLPLAKMVLEKPKCSSERFADFVYDWYQGWVNESKLFSLLQQGVKEHFLIGEAFFFIEHSKDIKNFAICPVAKRQIDHKERMRGPTPESSNPVDGVDELSIYQWSAPKGRGASLIKQALELGLIEKTANCINLDQLLPTITQEVTSHRAKLASALEGEAKLKIAAMKTAAPGDEAPDTAPEPLMDSPLQSIMNLRGDAPAADAPAADGDLGDAPAGDEGALPEGDMGGDMGGDPLGGMGGGFGGGGGMGDMGGDPMGGPSVESPHILNLKRYLELLERKKKLLEELRAVKEERKLEFELFSHVTNQGYWGPKRIVLLPPDVVSIKREKKFNSEPTICFKPSADLKQKYLESKDTSNEDKDQLESEGTVPLNDDPLEGSYVIHFARKKTSFEDHGHSVLQRCLRTIIYRDKLRQVQNTLASRHMTPITFVVAEDVPESELLALRVQIDEAKHDPDFSIVVNYQCTWQELGSDGRLLALDSEWTQTNAELAVGMGFSPDLLTGDGLFSNDRLKTELLCSTYMQLREELSSIVENLIFRPMAMRKGFYEIDDYGNPRWIYPKLNFSRLALRDQGDVYSMLFNLYSKGSLPVDTLYEFLSLDPETCKRKLEEDLMSVLDSKFNQVLDGLYANLPDKIISSTDILDKVSQSLGLKVTELSEREGTEGTGEGV